MLLPKIYSGVQVSQGRMSQACHRDACHRDACHRHVTGTHVTGTHVTGTGLLTLFWFKSKIIDFHIITPYIYYCSNYNIISDVFNACLISSDAQNLNTSHTHGLY